MIDRKFIKEITDACVQEDERFERTEGFLPQRVRAWAWASAGVFAMAE